VFSVSSVEGSLKPRPVMGSVGDSWTTRDFGREARALEPEKMDWSKWRYKSTVPSARPIARWESVEDNAIVVAYTRRK
jgi:hypothetical protein